MHLFLILFGTHDFNNPLVCWISGASIFVPFHIPMHKRTRVLRTPAMGPMSFIFATCSPGQCSDLVPVYPCLTGIQSFLCASGGEIGFIATLQCCFRPILQQFLGIPRFLGFAAFRCRSIETTNLSGCSQGYSSSVVTNPDLQSPFFFCLLLYLCLFFRISSASAFMTAGDSLSATNGLPLTPLI